MESTPNYGPISKKFGQIVWFTKKMTWFGNDANPSPNYGETAVCPLGREGFKWPKLRFSLYKHPQNGYSPLIIWWNGIFSFGQHCPVVAGTWLEYRSVCFFLGKKSRFLPYDPNFGQRPVHSPQRDFSFPTLGSLLLCLEVYCYM